MDIKVYKGSHSSVVVEIDNVVNVCSLRNEEIILNHANNTFGIINVLNPTYLGLIRRKDNTSYISLSQLYNELNNGVMFLRSFTHRDGYLLKDSVSGNDAEVLFPVSKFNGEDSQARVPMVFNSSVDYNRYKISFSASTMTSYKVIVGLHVGLGGALGTLYTNNGRLICVAFGKSFKIPVDVYIVNEIVNLDVTIDLLNDTLLVLKNGVELYKNISMGYVANIYNIPRLDLGNLNNSGAFNGLVYNFNQYNRDGDIIFSSNLPHLGYGFDENNNPVELTNTNVGVDYDKEGSTWLLDKGCVRRNGDIIPNNKLGLPLFPVESGDVIINSSAFLNDSDFMVDFRKDMDGAILLDEAYSFYNKDNTAIFKDEIRASDYYDSSNTLLFHSSEIFNMIDFVYPEYIDLYTHNNNTLSVRKNE